MGYKLLTRNYHSATYLNILLRFQKKDERRSADRELYYAAHLPLLAA